MKPETRASSCLRGRRSQQSPHAVAPLSTLTAGGVCISVQGEPVHDAVTHWTPSVRRVIGDTQAATELGRFPKNSTVQDHKTQSSAVNVILCPWTLQSGGATKSMVRFGTKGSAASTVHSIDYDYDNCSCSKTNSPNN